MLTIDKLICSSRPPHTDCIALTLKTTRRRTQWLVNQVFHPLPSSSRTAQTRPGPRIAVALQATQKQALLYETMNQQQEFQQPKRRESLHHRARTMINHRVQVVICSIDVSGDA